MPAVFSPCQPVRRGRNSTISLHETSQPGAHPSRSAGTVDIRNSVNHGGKKQGALSLRSELHLTAFSSVAYDFVLVMRRDIT
ncbi:hypothetical protein COMA2_30272 [Candidatus Nitrospira nitrificans]|uniref:Uncharacterized protein n=1 Tax=Candidatus Nitrospira nitrificans TaxID=1742973 RepID=A0A0S4LIQ3_9BACT|nr:hypothetical protein COMA2_30272 [Candidatus Nitrospira nitrificans]